MSPHTIPANPIKHEIKETISLGLPLISSWLIYSLSGFIGTAMVAKLGPDALAASVLVNTLWSVMTVLFFGVLSALSVMVAHQYGAKNYPAIGVIMHQGVFLSLAASIFIAVIFSMTPWLFQYTSQSPAVIKLAVRYAHAIVWCTPGMILLVIMEYFFNGIGRTKLSLIISLIEVPIEIFLIYVFIFGKFGIPAFGIAGVGYGLAASFTLTTIVLFIYLTRARFVKPFELFKRPLTFNKQYFRELLIMGLPIGGMYLIEVTSFVIATFMMARFSTLVLAAHQIVMQYLGLTISAAFAIAQTISIRIGQNAGRQYKEGIRYAAYIGLILSFILMLFVSCLYIFFPTFLLSIDLNVHDPANADLLHTCITLMAILAIFQLLDGMRITVSGVLRGLKDTKPAMYVSFIGFWLVGLTSAFIGGFVLHWQGIGVWMGLTFGIGVGACILLLRLRYMLKHLNLAKLATDQS